MPLWIRIEFYCVLIAMQNSGASFKVISSSTFSTALALNVQVCIDSNKPQTILRAVTAHINIYFRDISHQYTDLSYQTIGRKVVTLR